MGGGMEESDIRNQYVPLSMTLARRVLFNHTYVLTYLATSVRVRACDASARDISCARVLNTSVRGLHTTYKIPNLTFALPIAWIAVELGRSEVGRRVRVRKLQFRDSQPPSLQQSTAHLTNGATSVFSVAGSESKYTPRCMRRCHSMVASNGWRVTSVERIYSIDNAEYDGLRELRRERERNWIGIIELNFSSYHLYLYASLALLINN
jgi:hypothetical protein